jgi:hypothetical protein
MKIGELARIIDIVGPVLMVDKTTGQDYLILGIGKNLAHESVPVGIPVIVGKTRRGVTELEVARLSGGDD